MDVSILGMLEGVKSCRTADADVAIEFQSLVCWRVLKAQVLCPLMAVGEVSILGMLEGVLKAEENNEQENQRKFQSLVCWRGC